MQSVMFNFRRDVPSDRQEEVLRNIGSWSGVTSAKRLKPDAKNPDLLRMAYVYVDQNIDPEQIVNRLNTLPEIEEASAPAKRELIK